MNKSAGWNDDEYNYRAVKSGVRRQLSRGRLPNEVRG